jgi:hypothetical protein
MSFALEDLHGSVLEVLAEAIHDVLDSLEIGGLLLPVEPVIVCL